MLVNTGIMRTYSNSRRPLHSNRLSRLEAFTVLELFIVLALMAILAGVGTLKFADSLQHHRCIAAGQQLVRELENLKRTAMLTSQKSTAMFDTSTNSVLLKNVLMADGVSIGEKSLLLSQESGSPCFERIALSDDSDTINFNGHGMASCDGVVVLRIGHHFCSVLIDSKSNAIRVLPGNRIDVDNDTDDDYESQ